MREISSFHKCPLCKSNKKTKPIPSYSNRYSEDIAKDLKVPEDYLLKLLSNVQCKNCGLFYKINWFNKNYLTKIFNKLIPTHPKGWDTKSKKFSKVFFLNCVKKFKKNNQNKSSEKFNKNKRELHSIIASIPAQNKKEENLIKVYIKKIKKNDYNFILKHKTKISNLIKYPKPFSRYSGYKNESLYKFIENKIGRIKTYSEIGCPQWGMMDMALKKNAQVSFFKTEKCFFWGRNCKNKKGVNCITKINNKILINSLNKNVLKSDFTGCFFVLDHVFAPINFIKSILEKTNSVGIFLEKMKKENSIYSKGVAVQHFSGWNQRSVNYLAKKLNKKLDVSFFDQNLKLESFYLLHS